MKPSSPLHLREPRDWTDEEAARISRGSYSPDDLRLVFQFLVDNARVRREAVYAAAYREGFEEGRLAREREEVLQFFSRACQRKLARALTEAELNVLQRQVEALDFNLWVDTFRTLDPPALAQWLSEPPAP